MAVFIVEKSHSDVRSVGNCSVRAATEIDMSNDAKIDFITNIAGVVNMFLRMYIAEVHKYCINALFIHLTRT